MGVLQEVDNFMEDKKEYKLYIPTNVKTRLEFFKGYGVSELIKTLIVLIALLPISIILFKVTNGYMIPVIFEFIGVAGTIIAITKDDNNLCIVSQIKYMIEFSKIQKEYRYKYYNKWRDNIV